MEIVAIYNIQCRHIQRFNTIIYKYDKLNEYKHVSSIHVGPHSQAGNSSDGVNVDEK